MKAVFTYGSLMFSPIWQSVVRGNYLSIPAELAGYKRFAVKGEDYPVIMPAGTTDTVAGQLYQAVNADDIKRLDTFEGHYYKRQCLNVICDGEHLEAEAYVLRPRFYTIAAGHTWDAEQFSQAGIKRFLNRYKGFR